MGVYKVIYDKDSNKIYEGEFEGEVREGKGSLYYLSGDIKYLGEWKNDAPDGLGVLFYENGNKFYEGQWKDGYATGQGTLFAEDGKKEYEGEFVRSKKNGVGRIYYIDGSSYEGEWRNDLREGEGKTYYVDGRVEYDGFWMNDKRHGKGTLYKRDGSKEFDGFFENGERLIIQKEELSDRNSLENIGIDVEVFDSEGKNIIDEGAKVSFFDENLEKENFEFEKTDTDIKSNMEFIDYIDNEELYENDYLEENLEEFSEGYSSDLEEDEFLEENITQDYNEENYEEELKDEIYLKDSLEDDKEGIEILEEDNDIEEKTDEEEIEKDKEEDDDEDEEDDETEEKSDDNEKVEEETEEQEIEDEDDIDDKQEDDKSVEVRVEKDKVYKYIEIGDIIYKGEFDEKTRTGYGKVYYKGVLKYEGFVKDGVFEGDGRLYDLGERVEFEGIFKAGKKYGYGISYDSVGNPIYKGEWKSDLQNGEGELLNSNGEVIYKGQFYKGKALGLGKSVENEIENILYRELEMMVGLEEVKDEIARLVSFLKMQILRKRVSYKSMDIPYVFTFEGNIGVGKENVARILGKIYYILGLIPEYNFIQRDLLAALEYTHDGEIEETMGNLGGGVLYLSNLYQSNYDDITEIVRTKELTDNILDLVEYSNGHFIIVFSGEEELIETMIHNKKELAKCIGKSITFFDYSVEEMIDYITNLSEEKDYILSDDLLQELESFFIELLENEKYNNRNGEFIQEIFTELVKEQCIRIDTYGLIDIENLKVLELQDFKNIENKICF